MDEATSLLPTVFATLLSIVLTIAVTIVALGPRSLAEARLVLGNLFPRSMSQAETAIASVEAMRRDPELANMYFLSRFLVMVVQESVGQLLAGLLAAWTFTANVSDKIVIAPFALASLWLAAICLIVYRRITDSERWRGQLLARASQNPLPSGRGSAGDSPLG